MENLGRISLGETYTDRTLYIDREGKWEIDSEKGGWIKKEDQICDLL